MTAGLRLAIIGLGAVGKALAESLAVQPGLRLVGVLTRTRPGELPPGVTWVDGIDALLALKADIVVECAGHQALRAFGPAVLAAGTDLLVASVGALADLDLETRLRGAAAAGGRLLIPSGALAGLDALVAARHAGLESVEYLGRKPPAAWRGTPAEELIDLDTVATATVFFEGPARSAALQFPLNANVVAGISLAGIGFDATRVRLMVDPEARSNHHSVTAFGAFGEISTQVASRSFPRNPRTSMLVPFSLVRTLRAVIDPVVV